MYHAEKKRLVILGCTGSIGTNVLDVVGKHPDRFEVVALAAGRNIALLREQIARFKPQRVCVLEQDAADALLKENTGAEILCGGDGYVDLALTENIDMVVSAQVGASGLRPTYAAVSAGRTIGLANKETLVMAGELIMDAALESNATILPIDSEHSAIYQSLLGHNSDEIRRIILTASGGPFRNRELEAMADITPEQALAHPNWDMGAKISIDSATMMNKGLEVIEARWLFQVPIDSIDVHVHPQSIIHSMVEYVDGSIVAQLGIPDMRIPIAYALSFPQRLELDLPALNLFDIGTLTFQKPDFQRFPCLRLAFEAGRSGGDMPTALNAANEEAVNLFLNHRIPFMDIPRLVEESMNRHKVRFGGTLEDILDTDGKVRMFVRESVRK